MKRPQRARMFALVLAVTALLIAGCGPSTKDVVSCHNDIQTRPSDGPGLYITYSGEGIEMEVLGPDGSRHIPVSETDITVDSGPAKLAEMGPLTPGTYQIHIKDAVGTRGYFSFEAIVAERKITRVRLICQ